MRWLVAGKGTITKKEKQNKSKQKNKKSKMQFKNEVKQLLS